ncbi:MAG: hypothetical protein PHC62_00605 [Candidatus Izemoplasmatales bacterium]|nr:hypothetical protein [Candidatus Izemoplasmatales bacterium]
MDLTISEQMKDILSERFELEICETNKDTGLDILKDGSYIATIYDSSDFYKFVYQYANLTTDNNTLKLFDNMLIELFN